ncbi:MAG: hypothetical protein V3W14_13790 [Candidatus Neomarinimicrobiota bacterium]
MQRRLIYLFLMTSFALAASPLTFKLGDGVSVEPIFFGMHRTDGGTWLAADEAVSLAGWGVRGLGSFGKWELSTELVLMRFFGLPGKPSSFTPERGFGWQANVAKDQTKLDTDYATLKMAYKVNGFVAQAGKYSSNWGPGIHSLTISEKPPTYPQFGFDWDMGSRIRYRFTHADLRSGIPDNNLSSSDPITGIRRLYLNRYLAAHRLELDWPRHFTLGFNEAVVYGERGIETLYLLPFVSFWSAQHYLGDLDNTQISLDLTWRPHDNLKVFGVFLMTEWAPQITFKKLNRNWFAWQGGAEARSLLRPNDRLAFEASWTDHRVYRHKFPINDYYSHSSPLGHWMGPHAQSILLAYDLELFGSLWMVAYNYVKRGELTDQMIIDQYQTIYYQRFSGNTETRRSLELVIARRVWDRLWIELGVTSIVWDNAGFVPDDPAGSTEGNVDKLTINAGFYYNFDLPGYNITRLLKR